MKPNLIKGNSHSDFRGELFFNNGFDASLVKRMYVIKNIDTQLIRGWQGHKIEQRWFSVVAGSFRIKLIQIDNWENPSKNLEINTFIINSNKLDILHAPPGYVTSIQALETNSRLLVMSDYLLGEIKDDEFRFAIDYFKIKIK